METDLLTSIKKLEESFKKIEKNPKSREGYLELYAAIKFSQPHQSNKYSEDNYIHSELGDFLIYESESPQNAIKEEAKIDHLYVIKKDEKTVIITGQKIVPVCIGIYGTKKERVANTFFQYTYYN